MGVIYDTPTSYLRYLPDGTLQQWWVSFSTYKTMHYDEALKSEGEWKDIPKETSDAN